MTQSKKILLVGGGSGGHILPLYPLAQELIQKGHQVHVITSNSKLDTKIIQDNFSSLEIEHCEICTGKLRAYLSLQNISDGIKVLKAIKTAKKMLKEIQPDVIFFKGGFVGFPILKALKSQKNKPKIFLHESDISAGRLTKHFTSIANHIFLSYPSSTINHQPPTIPRSCTPLFWHDPSITSKKANSENPLPQILIFGGSQGAQFLNNLILKNLETLTSKYNITLVTGTNNYHEVKESIQSLQPTLNSNLQVHPSLPQAQLYKSIAQSDLVITRAGASIFQILHLKTPSILIPLPGSAREHQLHNAQYFKDQKLCHYIEQKNITNTSFLNQIEKTLHDTSIKQNLDQSHITSSEKEIAQKMLEDL